MLKPDLKKKKKNCFLLGGHSLTVAFPEYICFSEIHKSNKATPIIFAILQVSIVQLSATEVV